MFVWNDFRLSKLFIFSGLIRIISQFWQGKKTSRLVLGVYVVCPYVMIIIVVQLVDQNARLDCSSPSSFIMISWTIVELNIDEYMIVCMALDQFMKLSCSTNCIILKITHSLFYVSLFQAKFISTVLYYPLLFYNWITNQYVHTNLAEGQERKFLPLSYVYYIYNG